MATTLTTPLIFYDIAMRPPTTETCCSPNPWKSRYALNFKNVSYVTTWVDLPAITNVRRDKVGVPAARKFADGTDFYTLPVLSDPTTKTNIGDSFDIAIHLQKAYPNSGAGNLFPSQKLDYTFSGDTAFFAPLSKREDSQFDEYSRFNTNVDAVFSNHVLLMAYGMPLDPRTAEATKAEFLRRSGLASWDDMTVRGEARAKMIKSFHDELAGLAKLFQREASGPFLLGTQASYADFIVGAWLRMAVVTLPTEEWEEVRTWHGGVFGQLHDALQKYAEVK